MFYNRKLIQKPKEQNFQDYGFGNNGFKMLLEIRSFFFGCLSFIYSFKIFIKCLLRSYRYYARCWAYKVSKSRKVGKTRGNGKPKPSPEDNEGLGWGPRELVAMKAKTTPAICVS